MKIAVTGAGGFIGYHLVKRLSDEGHEVYGVDCKQPEFGPTHAKTFHVMDLRDQSASIYQRLGRISLDRLYHLAADMGGIGYIETNKATIVRNNTAINLNVIEQARTMGVGRFLFTSSACVYPGYRQTEANVEPLREAEAYPADAEDGYGWEKLYMERMCRHYREDFKLDTRIVRFHNVFGPLGTYDGGREKSPAAICRKVALAKSRDEIEVWGDGKQTRSYCYIDDCVTGLIRLMESSYTGPLNLGTDRLVSIDELVDIVSSFDKKQLFKCYDTSKPVGVRGRNSDNTLLKEVLGWQPSVTLEEGLEKTYRWICEELKKSRRL